MKNKSTFSIILIIVLIIILCFSCFFIYKRISSNKEISNNEENIDNKELSLDEIRDRFKINTISSGQSGKVYKDVQDTKTNKVIIDNLEDMGQSQIYLLKYDNKPYIYIECTDGLNKKVLNSKLFDEKGNIIFDNTNKYKFSLIFKDFDFGNLNYTFEVLGAYKENNGVIEKVGLDGTVISKSKEYDEVLQVAEKYSMIYQKSDDSVYIISNEESYSKKITTKEKEYCFLYIDANSISNTNEHIIIYESSCPEPDGPVNNYQLDLKTDNIEYNKYD